MSDEVVWKNNGLEDLQLARFVVPSSLLVQEVLNGTQERLCNYTQVAHKSLDSAVRNGCYQELVEALYWHLKNEWKFQYDIELAFDFTSEEQWIRLPEAIRRHHLRVTCLDMSLFLASCLARVGMSPIIVLLQGHALSAVWTTRDYVPKSKIDLADLQQLVSDGKILPIESTCLAAGNPHTNHRADFAAAVGLAKQSLGGATTSDYRAAVDVLAAWDEGVQRIYEPREINAFRPGKQSQAERAAEKARSSFSSGDYRNAEALYEQALQFASEVNDGELQAKALEGVLNSQINQSLVIDRINVFPIAQWDQLISKLRLVSHNRSQVAFCEARVALLSNNLVRANSALDVARCAGDIANNVETYIPLAIELQRCIVMSNTSHASNLPDSMKSDVATLQRDCFDLVAQNGNLNNAVKLRILCPLVELGITAQTPIGSLLSKLTEIATVQSNHDSGISKVQHEEALQVLERTCFFARNVADAEDFLRSALSYSMQYGTVLNEARIGDSLADCIQKIALSVGNRLIEVVELRESLANRITESRVSGDISKELQELYIHHKGISLLDKFDLIRSGAIAETAEAWAELASETEGLIQRLTDSENIYGVAGNRFLLSLRNLVAEANVNLGDYGVAARHFERLVAEAGKLNVPIDKFLPAARDCVYFYCAAGDISKSRQMLDFISSIGEEPSDLSKLIQLTKQTRDWLQSEDAEQLRRHGREYGIRAAIQPTVDHLLQLWDDLPPEGQFCAGTILDYWGRGSFLRLCVAIQARPTDCIAIDATSIQDIQTAAEMLCPMFEVVLVKWKGEIISAGLAEGIVKMDRPQQWLYGSGFVHHKGGFLGFSNELPEQVVNYLRTTAKALVKAGRLFVAPAQLIGCAQQFVGSNDVAFSERLLGGTFLGSGEDSKSRPHPESHLKLTATKIPYFRDVNLTELNGVLDDLGDAALPFHRHIRELMSDNSFSIAHSDRWKLDAMEREIQEATREIDRLFQRLSRGKLAIESTCIQRHDSERGPSLAGSSVSEMMASILPFGSPLRPWVSYYAISRLRGQFSWSQPPTQWQSQSRVKTIEFSWLAPPTIGAGCLFVRKSN